MSERSYYDVLGVAKDADEKVLKSAFRKKAMEYHPDRNPGCKDSEAKFKEMSEAYEVLNDPQKRAAYDRFGKAGLNGGGGRRRAHRAGRKTSSATCSATCSRNSSAASSARPAAAPRAARTCAMITRSAWKTPSTASRPRSTCPPPNPARPARASGAEPGTQPETCTTCQGHGRVRVSQGFFTMERTCGRCQGSGQIIKTPCRECGGRGAVRKDRTLSVNIPAGIEDGQRIRLSGEGEPGLKNGPKGDLYIFVSVREHELFERDGQTLFARTPVTMTTAALGGEIEMPTIDGARMKVSIPEGAQTGKRMRLKGKGMPNLRGGSNGDMVVELFVETPTHLTAKQKELLQQFAEECCPSGKCHPESQGFFKKVKKFFEEDTRA